MSYGIDITRSDGTQLISNLYPHYYFVKKVQLNSAGEFYDTATYTDNVIVALAPLNPTGVSQSFLGFAKGKYKYNNGMGMDSYPPSFDPGGTSTLAIKGFPSGYAYIFDTAPPSENSGYGLIVFNDSGGITYTSNRAHAMHVNTISGMAQTSTSTYVKWPTVAHPKAIYTFPKPAVNFAIVPLTDAYSFFALDYEEYQYTEYEWRSNQVSLKFVQTNTFASNWSGGWEVQPYYQALVLDVSRIY